MLRNCVETYIFGVYQIQLTYCSTDARETLWFEPLCPRRRPSRYTLYEIKPNFFSWKWKK